MNKEINNENIEEPAQKLRKRSFIRVVLLLVVPVLVSYGALQMYLSSGGKINTDNAYVKANLHNMSSEIDGRVKSVLVKENEWIKKGQPILELDPEPFEIAVRAAEANLAAVKQELKSLLSEYRRASVDIELAKKRTVFLTTRYERQKRLRANGVSSVARLDEAAFELQIAEQELRAAHEKRRKLLNDLGGDANALHQSHPRVKGAIAGLERTQLDLQRTRILAPTDSIVARVKPEPGEVIRAMEPVVLLVNKDEMWIEANLKETKLTHIRVGQKAEIVIDAYPNSSLQARVHSIAPATGAEFALLPPQNASGNWVKVVQRLPVRLVVTEPKQKLRLRAGMTATVSIETGHKPQLPSFIKQALAFTERFQGQ